LKGLLFNAGDFDLLLGALRPFRTSWFTVGILFSCCIFLAFYRDGYAAKQATKNPSRIRTAGGSNREGNDLRTCFVARSGERSRLKR